MADEELYRSPYEGMTWETFVQVTQGSSDGVFIRKDFFAFIRDLNATSLFSQIYYWHTPAKRDGASKLRVQRRGKYWLVRMRKQWLREAFITEKQFDRAIKILIDLGVAEKETILFDSKTQLGVRLVKSRIMELLSTVAYDKHGEVVPPEKIYKGKTWEPTGQPVGRPRKVSSEEQALESSPVIPELPKGELVETELTRPGEQGVFPKGDFQNSPNENSGIPVEGIPLTETTTQTTAETTVKTLETPPLRSEVSLAASGVIGERLPWDMSDDSFEPSSDRGSPEAEKKDRAVTMVGGGGQSLASLLGAPRKAVSNTALKGEPESALKQSTDYDKSGNKIVAPVTTPPPPIAASPPPNPAGRKPKKPRPRDEYMDAIAMTCYGTLEGHTKSEWKLISGVKSSLVEAGVSIEDVQAIHGWMKADKYWKDKAIGPKSIEAQVSKWRASKGKPSTQGNHRNAGVLDTEEEAWKTW